MAHTLVSDIVVPEVWSDYIVNKTAEKSAIIQSGIAGQHPLIQEQLDAGGQFINIPFWDDLTGNSEVLSDSASLTVNNQTADSQIAVRLARGKSWGYSVLVGWATGVDDPVEMATTRIADWWARDIQDTLIAILTGVFATGGALVSTHVYDGTAGVISADSIAEAAALLGDSRSDLVAIALHSKQVKDLEKADLIDTERDSTGKVMFKTYQGHYRIIEDDNCPVTSGTPDQYRGFLFGYNSIAYGEAKIDPLDALEPDRDAAASSNRIFTRKNMVIHPVGLNYAGAANPANDVLDNAASWTKKYEDKQIRIVAIDTD